MPVREDIVLKFLEKLKTVTAIKTLRRTQPTIKDVNGFHASDFPAVAVTDKGFASDHRRAHPPDLITIKTTALQVGVTIYVAFGATSETDLNDLVESIINVMEAEQDLGIADVFIPEPSTLPAPAPGDPAHPDYEELYVKTVSCTGGQRSPFPPVFAESLDFVVEYNHSKNII